MQFNFVLQILDTPDTKMILTAAREVESIATNYSTKVSSFQSFLECSSGGAYWTTITSHGVWGIDWELGWGKVGRSIRPIQNRKTGSRSLYIGRKYG